MRIFKDVETYRPIEIGHVQVANVIVPLLRHAFEHSFGERTMRVDDAKSVAACHVLLCEVAKKERLTGAGGTDDGHVLQALIARETDFGACSVCPNMCVRLHSSGRSPRQPAHVV